MKVRTVTLTMEPADVELLEKLAAEEDVDPEEWAAEAVIRRLRQVDGLKAIAEYEAEHGAFTPEEDAAGRKELDRWLGR